MKKRLSIVLCMTLMATSLLAGCKKKRKLRNRQKPFLKQNLKPKLKPAKMVWQEVT